MLKTVRPYSYFKTGGTCAELYVPTSREDVARVMLDLFRRKVPHYILGGGTNSLVSDEHWDGAVLVLSEIKELRINGDVISLGAGVENTEFSQFAHQHSLAGAEFMNRLPGKIGGTVRMNARCYGGEMSQIVVTVHSVAPDGAPHSMNGKDVFRGYKDTSYMTNGHLIVGCDVRLSPGEKSAIFAKMKHCEDDRVQKHQFDFPSCGCVFKNDYSVGVPSGVLLDLAGVKQLKVGGASISPHHANFIFNKDATSRDVLELSLKMRDAVWNMFGAWLEYEMEVLGHVPEDLKLAMHAKRSHNLKLAALAPLRAKWAAK